MKSISYFTWCFVFILSFNKINAQNNSNAGEIHGNFEVITQFYNRDTVIGAPIVPEKSLMNGFLNLIYTKGKFTAGLRYEAYLNVLQGFDPGYAGTGIPYRFASYKDDNLEFTVGSFYEQFGTGMILRSYEARGLGVDNVFEGVRAKYQTKNGLYLKGLIGKQRLFFGLSDGIVRGLDAEWSLNEALNFLSSKKTKITIGGSFVSKYQSDQNITYILPENVGAGGGRISLNRGNTSLQAEYVYKINDPSFDNGYIYKPGQGLFLSATYSQKGFGVTLSGKAIDNMSFRSDRDQSVNNLMINYLPALTRQHTYNLSATLYPYATQPNGEVAFQVDVVYTFKKGSPLGGKYGTTISINAATAHGLDSTSINDLNTTRIGYKTKFFSPGQEIYFVDFNAELTKKVSKDFKFKLFYQNMVFNNDVMKLAGTPGTYYVDIAVAEGTIKFNTKNALRIEAQALWTKQDQGNWATLVAEYTIAPHWFFSIIDQYNYKNPVGNELHYPIFSSGYIKGGNRFQMSYGRQRAGIFCVGGVCRVVPASNGLTFSITSTF